MAELIESLVEVGCPRNPHTALATPASVIDGALNRVRGLGNGRVVRRHVLAELPVVRVNGPEMERVLANLIQNAIKYSPPRSPIDVMVRITANHELEFSVRDRGPGVPVEDRQRIFQPFFRTQPAVASAALGHGLGLAICQSIVSAHGGRIRVSDRRGGGASFSVYLPLPVRTSEKHLPVVGLNAA